VDAWPSSSATRCAPAGGACWTASPRGPARSSTSASALDITGTDGVLSGLSEQDIVVLATGALPAPAAFTDDGSVPVLTSSEILRGQPVASDGLVLVVGGTEPHLDPLLTARLLAAQGHPVRVITELVTVAPAVEQRTFNHVLRTLATFDVAVETSTRLAAIAAGRARTVQLLAGRTAELPIGAVVLAHSRRPDPSAARLAAGLRGIHTIHVVGDAPGAPPAHPRHARRHPVRSVAVTAPNAGARPGTRSDP